MQAAGQRCMGARVHRRKAMHFSAAIFPASATRSMHCKRRCQQHQLLHAYSGNVFSSGYTPTSSDEPPTPQRDILTRAFDFCGQACTRAANIAVGRATDMLQALAPPTTPRDKVETAVKGALTLLGLALFKSVLSVVLLLGALALALYTITQVFGFEVAAGGSGGSTTTARSVPPAGGDWLGGSVSGASAPWQQQPPPQQYGQQQYGQQPLYGQAADGWQQAYGGAAPSAPPMPQDDVVDVWYGGNTSGTK